MAAAPIAVLLLLAGAAGSAWSQPGIYSCVDARGKRLSADRPIAECQDREQKVFGPSGAVRRVVPPVLTPAQRAEEEQRERQAAEQRLRAGEERRMQRALLARYPNPAAHEAERARVLRAQQDVLETARARVQELREERATLDAQAASPAPADLARQLEQNEQQLAAQQRFVHGQEEELKRLTRRLDEELARLKLLWVQGATVAAPRSVPAAR